MNPIHIIPSYFSKIHYEIILPLRVYLLSGLFLSGFLILTCIHSLATYIAHLSSLNRSFQLHFPKSSCLWNSSLWIFLQPHINSSLLDPNILLRILFSDILSLSRSLNARDQVSHPHTVTGKIILSYTSVCTNLDCRREDKRFWSSINFLSSILYMEEVYTIETLGTLPITMLYKHLTAQATST
jgi:hypothetical protein